LTAKLEKYFTRFNWLNCACPPKLCEGVACHGKVTLNELVKQINLSREIRSIFHWDNLLNKNIEPIYANKRPDDIIYPGVTIYPP